MLFSVSYIVLTMLDLTYLAHARVGALYIGTYILFDLDTRRDLVRYFPLKGNFSR